MPKMWGEAKAFDGTDPGAGAENDLMPIRTDLNGIPYVNQGHPFFFQTSATFALVTAITAGAILATNASNALYITDILCTANTGPATFTFSRDNAITTPVEVLRIYVPANATFAHSFRQPWQIPVNSNLGVATSVTVTAVQILGYAGP